MQSMGSMRAFSGLSGRTYLYTEVDPNNVGPLLLAAGNFIFGRSNGTDIDIVCIGESNSVYGTMINTTIWLQAKSQHGADLLFTHLAADPAARDAEKQDLIGQWKPPLTVP
jgi:hypothetical protein